MKKALLISLVAVYSLADCLSCHKGIENIKDPNSPMMKQIAALSKSMGDKNNCVFCHGGNPKATTAKEAHVPPKNHPGGLKVFAPDPGSRYVVKNTCGMCHMDTVKNLEKSLMTTEAGKIQGNLIAFGVQKERKAMYGNFDVKDDDGFTPAWGTCTYKEYMKYLTKKYPDNFVKKLKALPEAAKDIDDVKGKSKEELIKLAAIAYTRSDCLRCHVGVKGRQGRGDYRGMGCSACHIPYSNEGIYEGNDPTISKKVKGKLLVHTMQGSRKSKVYIPSTGKTYSGIDVETCNSCHNRGKRIGVSYTGLMESAYMSPFQEGGKSQPKLHGKRYLHIAADVHYKAGMTCQDCHTSIDMHGDGNIHGTTLAQVEIECQDCHGTPNKYPWELPIGAGEKSFNKGYKKARGVTKKLPNWMKYGTVYNPEDGYILTARGNPFGNVIKRGNDVIVHLANGKDLKVPVLKNLAPNFNAKARVAMVDVASHMKKMECYSCHATWAPQCYGCHVKVDMRDKKTDWLASALPLKNGLTWESIKKYKKLQGKAKETRSYLRWEDPILGINGEGMISPIIPGCQVTYTIIGPDGKTVTLNVQTKVKDNGNIVAATDIAPAQPHTVQKEARSCESCHTNPKTLGYGTNDGAFLNHQNQNLVFDIKDKDGNIAVKNATTQIAAIPGMNYDWTKVVDRNGKQLQLVGSHWPDSRPLDKEIRDKMEKTGTCLGCHSQMRIKALWQKVNKHPGILTNKDHQEVMKKALKALAKEK